MIGLAIRFELGHYHANPWGSHVNDASIEWPPSPWRLIRALYATSRTNVGLIERREAIDRALQGLVAAPPPVFELPRATAAHTRHYMPKARYSAIHSGDTAKVIDGFLAVDPSAELRAWWEVSLDAKAVDGLSAAAHSLGYLGRSESVCSARLIVDGLPTEATAAPIEADADHADQELVELLCPGREQSLDALAVSVTELRKQRRLIPPGTHRVTYAVPRPDSMFLPTQSRRLTSTPTLALLRVAGSQRPALNDAVAVGQALRNALQSQFGKSNGGSASRTFSGRDGDDPRRDQHGHAHYLALPDGHGRRIGRVVVWAPEGLGAEEVAALARLTYVRMTGAEPMQAALAALGTVDQLDIPELIGPSRSWKSLTPFGLVRHPKTRRGVTTDSPEDQLRCELEHRGITKPVEIRLERGSWHRFRSSKVGTSRLARARLFGVHMRFSGPMQGPLALGALSHYGLGLMQPDD